MQQNSLSTILNSDDDYQSVFASNLPTSLPGDMA